MRLLRFTQLHLLWLLLTISKHCLLHSSNIANRFLTVFATLDWQTGLCAVQLLAGDMLFDLTFDSHIDNSCELLTHWKINIAQSIRAYYQTQRSLLACFWQTYVHLIFPIFIWINDQLHVIIVKVSWHINANQW